MYALIRGDLLVKSFSEGSLGYRLHRPIAYLESALIASFSLYRRKTLTRERLLLALTRTLLRRPAPMRKSRRRCVIERCPGRSLTTNSRWIVKDEGLRWDDLFVGGTHRAVDFSDQSAKLEEPILFLVIFKSKRKTAFVD